MTDKIEITREQYEAWAGKGGCYNFDSLKAFVEKKERREFTVVQSGDVTLAYLTPEAAEKSLSKGCISSTQVIHVREVLPDDLPPMTKAEAREWITAACEKEKDPDSYTTCLSDLLQALGLDGDE